MSGSQPSAHLAERVLPVGLARASEEVFDNARVNSTFSCDIAYSERPAASRAWARSR